MNINRIYIYGRIALAGWLLLCVFSSCETEEARQPETEGLRICLRLPEALTVETKAAGDKILDGITIGDVWVLQYAADSTFKHKQYISGTDILAAAANQTITLTTSGFSNEDSRFYVIANAGNTNSTSSFSGTETELQALFRATNDGWSQSEYNLVSAGPVVYKAQTGTSSDKAVIVAPLQRAFARVQVAWKFTGSTGSGTVKINSVKVTNLPKKMAFYARGGRPAGIAYPDIGDIIKDTKTVSSQSLTQNSTLTFYMPGNLRGMGTGTKFTDKNVVANGPGGTLAGCTYLELEGTYTYPGSSGQIGVKYRIYLGGNLVNDYNIRRGYSYAVTFNISGANSADVRVTVTDDNVVVFDDVETVDNTVDF
ncbi:DUF4906 domain-containing protein [Parabacteroides bouchesdurhonensis]|uniref:DUF4906 domain-containing protein n=1 Tax=Parabacteroides bouchesdurhonensis TaxID=1936995 RepID=UPI000C839F4A|nr:DUF4906 domain-containing protein [Parabacteroides bouchesdurhonensis]